MQFLYTAKSATGDIHTGHISAADVDAVKRALREQSLFLIDARKKTENSAFRHLSRARG
jgi:type II secretory pathway component PulF